MIALNSQLTRRIVIERPLSSPSAWIHALRRLVAGTPRASQPRQAATTVSSDIAAATWEDAEWQ